MKRFEAKYNVPICEGDGPTECSPVTSINPIYGKRKPGSIGKVIPNVQMKIVDQDGNEMPVGEIVVRGGNVLNHFLKNGIVLATWVTSMMKIISTLSIGRKI